MRDGTQIKMGISPRPPIISIPHLALCHPAIVLPTLLIPLYQQSQYGRWDIPVQAKDTDALLAYSHS